jgi:DNA-directed RNA polymerase subunit RPC12/RpoP
MIQFRCPSCQAPIEVPDQYAGRAARCPTCSGRIRVPQKSGGDQRTEMQLLEDASATSSAVFRVEGRLYEIRPALDGLLIAAAIVAGLSLAVFAFVGVSVQVYSPWALAGLIAGGIALFGGLLVLPALYNIRRSHGRKTGQRLALTIAAIAAALVLLFATVSVVCKLLEDSTPCHERLQAVYQAFREYAARNGGRLPPRPEALVEQHYLPASKLTCLAASGVREGDPTYLQQSYDPRIDFNADPSFPGDVMLLMESSPTWIVDQASGKKVLARYALQFDGTVSYVPASENDDEDKRLLVEAFKRRDAVLTRVLETRKINQEQETPPKPAPPPPVPAGPAPPRQGG